MRPRGQTFNAAIHELSTPLIHVFLISQSNHVLIYSLALITFEYEVEEDGGGRVQHSRKWAGSLGGDTSSLALEKQRVPWIRPVCAWSRAERLVGGSYSITASFLLDRNHKCDNDNDSSYLQTPPWLLNH